jgi:hypothetical protein
VIRQDFRPDHITPGKAVVVLNYLSTMPRRHMMGWRYVPSFLCSALDGDEMPALPKEK